MKFSACAPGHCRSKPPPAKAVPLSPSTLSLTVFRGRRTKAFLMALGDYYLRHTYDEGTLEMRRVLYGVTWEDYLKLLDATPDRYLRPHLRRRDPGNHEPAKGSRLGGRNDRPDDRSLRPGPGRADLERRVDDDPGDEKGAAASSRMNPTTSPTSPACIARPPTIPSAVRRPT